MDLFYATMSAQLSAFFPNLTATQGSICSGIGNIVNKFDQVGTSNIFSFAGGVIRFLDQATNLTTDTSIKPCYAYFTNVGFATITCPISATQYYVVAVLSFNTPTDPFTTSTNVIISPTAMTLAQIAAQSNPLLYNPLFAITTTDGTNYTIHVDGYCAFNYGYIIGNPFPDITDIAGLVSIIGAGGLSVTNNVVVGGNLDVTGLFGCAQNGSFVRNGLGPFVFLSRQTSTLPNTYNLGLYSEVADSSIPGETHIAILQANGGSQNPVLAAGYSTKRWHMLNCAPGDTSFTDTNALAMLGDLSGTLAFSVTDSGGNAWVLLCTSYSGTFPGINGILIEGYANTTTLPPGTYDLTIDLAAAGIITTAPSLTIKGVITVFDNVGIVAIAVRSAAPANLIFELNIGSASVTAIQFFITYK
jgi:hypothetical protein